MGNVALGAFCTTVVLQIGITLMTKYVRTSSPTPGMEKEEGESFLGAFGLHFGSPFSLNVLISVGVVCGCTFRGVRIHVSGLGCIVAPCCDAFGTILVVQMPLKIVF